ncbi:MAG: hypothetical protein NVS3B12_14390 [Acidimicrobiales bacterium]
MIATTPHQPHSALNAGLRAACVVQAVALLCALLILAALNHILLDGVASVGIGAAAGAAAWRYLRA